MFQRREPVGCDVTSEQWITKKSRVRAFQAEKTAHVKIKRSERAGGFEEPFAVWMS